MGATTSSRIPRLSSEQIKAALNRFDGSAGREWGFDVFDCPVDLFEYIADITIMYKFEGSAATTSDRTLEKAAKLGHTVRAWDVPHGTSEQRRELVEIWRHGTLLYLIHLFRRLDEVFDTAELLSSVFRRAERLSSETSRMFSLTWPLFQAGLSLRPEDCQRKQWLRDEFKTKFETLGCGNPKLAIGVLEEVWRTGNNYYLNPQALHF